MPAMEIDKVLAAALAAAKSKPHKFALIAKGATVVHLIVDKTPIKSAAIQAAKKEHGGTTVVRGQCHGGPDGELLFDVAKEPGIQDNKLKEYIVAVTHLSLKPHFKVVAGLAEETGETDSAEDSSSDTSSSDGSAQMKRLNGLSAAIKTAMAGPDGPRVQKLFVAVAALIKGHDLAQADKMLGELESLVSHGPTSSPSSLAPQKPSGSVKPDDFPKLWAAAKKSWQEASDMVDAQIAKLQGVLRRQNDDELHEIAEFGLNGATGNFKVPLMSAMKDVDSSSPETRAKAAQKALEIAAGFQRHLTTDERVAACDENPFGVALSIKSTLTGAIAEIAKALRTAI
jgi:hypothetical protein